MTTAFASIAAGVLSRTPGHRKEGGATDPVRRESYHEASPKAQPWRLHRHGSGSRKHWAAIKGAALGAFDRLYRTHSIDLRQARADRRAGTREDVTPTGERLHGDDRAILWYLLDRYNYLTGQLFPSYATIATETGKSLGFVKASLARLKRFGFVSWVRRTKTKEGAEGTAGPQLEQTSNAYYFDWAAQLVTEAKSTFQNLLTIAMKKLRGDTKHVRSTVPSDPELAAVLSRMSASIDRRDGLAPSASS
ncbi:helix-turn-helix domain-containing protein [Sphingomonas sp.]|jgi:hypothetical protein|uniref:helix-turn-helix domain-containing protein n=1 Tax=Sphingomonas sp. TaxID=28214 RepID=UPI000DBC0EE0|nr:helix-turn-helix domain-containing protein [Sphingomonas sp.]PZT91684.1 MAG: hypothetical protein DI625_15275 [Sphingomonas sp.]